jgi:glycerol-3-phosphate acyltransferase PlsY
MIAAVEDGIVAVIGAVLELVAQYLGDHHLRLVFVAAALVLGFVSQIVLPYAGGSATQTVNLTDPVLVTAEVILTVLMLVWLYVGVSDYRFTTRLSMSIRKARALEREIEKEITPTQPKS